MLVKREQLLSIQKIINNKRKVKHKLINFKNLFTLLLPSIKIYRLIISQNKGIKNPLKRNKKSD